MPEDLSIKNVPDDLVKRLEERATGHDRSLQGELMAIIEEAVGARLTARHIVRNNELRGLSTPSEAVAIVRRD